MGSNDVFGFTIGNQRWDRAPHATVGSLPHVVFLLPSRVRIRILLVDEHVLLTEVLITVQVIAILVLGSRFVVKHLISIVPVVRLVVIGRRHLSLGVAVVIVAVFKAEKVIIVVMVVVVVDYGLGWHLLS